ncbi:MAG TPA: response regulator [Edaphobacter sp.]
MQLILFANMDNNATQPRLLMVDDDALSRELFSLLLRQKGYAVEAVSSGEAALLHLQAQQALPEVVLTDMQMPGITGAELALQLRSLYGKQMMLLAMSGSEPKRTDKQVFDGFLLKPFTVDQLAATISGCAPRTDSQSSDSEHGTVLDLAVYQKLSASLSPAQIEQLYTLCLQDIGKRFSDMERAAAQSDDAVYRKEAHALKGGCGMVGAMELQKLATLLEEQGLHATNHVATHQEFLLAAERLRRILVGHEIIGRFTQSTGELGHD